MANFLQKAKVKTAVEQTSKMTVKGQHDTSIDFGQLIALKGKFLPKGRGTVKAWTYSNMEPLPQPTWGEVKYENRIFFVPMVQIFKGYNDFREDVIHVDSASGATNLSQLPYASMGDIVRAVYNQMVEVTGSYDIEINVAGTNKQMTHTKNSLGMLKILEGLGYKLRWATASIPNVNICRLLALAKVYYEYFWNNNYKGTTQDVQIRMLFERDDSNLVYSWQDIEKLLLFCIHTFYNRDYFTGAWDNPNGPNVVGTQSTPFKFEDPNEPTFEYASVATTFTAKGQVMNSGGMDPMMVGNNPQGGTAIAKPVAFITEYMENTLRGLQGFLKRNQLAGAETLDRMMARWGMVPRSEIMKKTRQIGVISWMMNVSPVMSNSDTAASGGENLGSYAGYGYGVSDDKFRKEGFSFETDEDGILIETLTVTPVETYTQGIDGENLALTKFDLPSPEFDTIGVDPIIKAELLVGDSIDELANADQQMWTTIFGFIPRYGKYKIMRDCLSGNFTNPNHAARLLPYTMQRRFDPATNNHTTVTHNINFTAITDGDQYDRIFYAPASKALIDNFRIHHEIEIEWWSWMKPLYDIYQFEHEKGKEVEVHLGQRAN